MAEATKHSSGQDKNQANIDDALKYLSCSIYVPIASAVDFKKAWSFDNEEYNDNYINVTSKSDNDSTFYMIKPNSFYMPVILDEESYHILMSEHSSSKELEQYLLNINKSLEENAFNYDLLMISMKQYKQYKYSTLRPSLPVVAKDISNSLAEKAWYFPLPNTQGPHSFVGIYGNWNACKVNLLDIAGVLVDVRTGLFLYLPSL